VPDRHVDEARALIEEE